MPGGAGLVCFSQAPSQPAASLPTPQNPPGPGKHKPQHCYFGEQIRDLYGLKKPTHPGMKDGWCSDAHRSMERVERGSECALHAFFLCPSAVQGATNPPMDQEVSRLSGLRQRYSSFYILGTAGGESL
jgi:hypothetical protein